MVRETRSVFKVCLTGSAISSILPHRMSSDVSRSYMTSIRVVLFRGGGAFSVWVGEAWGGGGTH
jgi:hypothetical protein